MAGIPRIPNSFRREPAKREDPKPEDPKTEAVRETLRGNPFGKKYHGKTYGNDPQ